MFCFLFRLLLAFTLLGATLAYQNPCDVCTRPAYSCCYTPESRCCSFKRKRDVEPIDFKPLEDVEPIDFEPEH
ncbi:hypothetical protein Aduo_007312 [Ancylostoma duodenale]